MQNKERKTPEPGEFYRHFKGGFYQILSIATHSESKEKLVIYQALYDDFSVYARPLAMFMESIKRSEDSEEEVKWRFEKTDRESLRSAFREEMKTEEKQEGSLQEVYKENEKEDLQKGNIQKEEILPSEEIGDYFFDFLESKTYAKKKESINRYKNQYTQKDLNAVYTLLEIAPFEGSIQKQIQGVIKYLDTQSHFEAGRLRGE